LDLEKDEAKEIIKLLKVPSPSTSTLPFTSFNLLNIQPQAQLNKKG
jgi:hypothetical protein